MTEDMVALRARLALAEKSLEGSRRVQAVVAETAERNRMALERLAWELAERDACPHDRPKCSKGQNCADCWLSYALEGATAAQTIARLEHERQEERAKARKAWESRRPEPEPQTADAAGCACRLGAE